MTANIKKHTNNNEISILYLFNIYSIIYIKKIKNPQENTKIFVIKELKKNNNIFDIQFYQWSRQHRDILDIYSMKYDEFINKTMQISQ